MPDPLEIQTPRLRLRHWRPGDVPIFARMNADPLVMEHFPAVLSRAESDALAERITGNLLRNGWGLWAVEIPGRAAFAGFVGLAAPGFQAHFTPCVEIGWRLAAEHWGQGFASEAARAVLNFGMGTLELAEIVSFTSTGNVASRRVMERIGMHRNARDDFDHPTMPAGHRLQRHVLYRLAKT